MSEETTLEQQRVAALKKAGCGQRNVDALRKGRDTLAIRTAEDWLKGDETFLLLCGPPGVGKSVAATYVLWLHLQTKTSFIKERVGYVRAVDIAQWQLFSTASADKLDRLKRLEVLVVDNLGSEVTSDVFRQIMFDIIDARYSEGLKTVLTTNLPLSKEGNKESFASTYGTRIAHRIKSAGTVVVVKE